MILANRQYRSYRHTIKIPGGAVANIFITEGDDQFTPVMIQCNIGKVGTRMASFGITISRMLTDMLTAGLTLDECIGTLADLSLDLAELEDEENKEVVRSLPEAFWVALTYYKKMKL